MIGFTESVTSVHETPIVTEESEVTSTPKITTSPMIISGHHSTTATVQQSNNQVNNDGLFNAVCLTALGLELVIFICLLVLTIKLVIEMFKED